MEFLDLFLEADIAMTMSRPEPVAMEQAYAFIRAALFGIWSWAFDGGSDRTRRTD